MGGQTTREDAIVAKRIRMAWLASIVLGFALPATLADELEKAEKKLTAAWKKHKSVTATVTMVSRTEHEAAVVEAKSEGTYEAVRKRDQLLYRMDVTNTVVQKVGASETKTEQRITMINDGKYVHELIETVGPKIATKSKVEPHHATDPASTFALLRKDHSLKLLPEEAIDGQKVYVIEATPKQPGPVSKMVFYFLQEHGVLVKWVAHDQAAKPMLTRTFSDFKFDVKIDHKRFVFQAPPGVRVIDQTAEAP